MLDTLTAKLVCTHAYIYGAMYVFVNYISIFILCLIVTFEDVLKYLQYHANSILSNQIIEYNRIVCDL